MKTKKPPNLTGSAVSSQPLSRLARHMKGQLEPQGVLDVLQRAVRECALTGRSSDIGLILDALVSGVASAPDDVAAEARYLVCNWVLRTRIPDEPKWPLGDIVAVHRDLQTAWAGRSPVDRYPVVVDRVMRTVVNFEGQVVHRKALDALYLPYGITCDELTSVLAELQDGGVVFALNGGYWRFHDHAAAILESKLP